MVNNPNISFLGFYVWRPLEDYLKKPQVATSKCTVQHASLQLDVYSSPGNHLKHQLRKWLQYDPVNPSRFSNVFFESLIE